MSLHYIQRKSAISSALWFMGCGLGMTYYPIKKVYAGFDLGNTIWLCRKSEGFLCGDKNTQLDKFIADFQNYIIKHPRHANIIKRIYLQQSARFDSFINNRLANFDYSQSDNKTIWSDYQKILKAYWAIYPYSEPLAIAIGNLSDHIKEEFFQQGLSHDQFEKLLLPTDLSFIQKEQLDFFKIVLDNKGKTASPSTIEKLHNHHRRYTWLPYDYGVTTYSFNYFNNQLKKVLKEEARDTRKKYNELKNYSQNLKKEQKLIIKKFKITKRQQDLVNIVQVAFYLVDSKKELFTRLHWFSERLFKVISQRFNLPLYIVRYILPDEMDEMLNKGEKINSRKIQTRYDNCLFKISNKGRISILEGVRAKKIIDDFLASRDKAVSNDTLTGRIANKGVARGLVRIILDANKCNTFKHGEILVTSMTSPDYMLAARRAAAIITDEGGITCHASIVSREMGIPCVIGTKIATKVLRDGDLVEVDANQGIIKIIKRK